MGRDDLYAADVLTQHVISNPGGDFIQNTSTTTSAFIASLKKEFSHKYQHIFVGEGTNTKEVKLKMYRFSLPMNGSSLYMQIREFQDTLVSLKPSK
eukprot:2253621-Lingulodinium_polyedra.AAC.1